MTATTNRRVFLVTGASSGIAQALKHSYLQFPEKFGGELRFDLGEWRLGSPLAVNDLNVRIIHLAHDRNSTLQDTANALGLLSPLILPGSILISTVSAHSASKSLYGKKKLLEENVFLSSGATVIKSGLVIAQNPTAMHLKLVTMLKKFPIIPMPYLGNSKIFVTQVSGLIELIQNLTVAPINGQIIRGFNPTPYKLKEVLKVLSVQNNLMRVLVPLPYWLSRGCISLISNLFPQSPTVDSLKSLINEISEEDLNLLVSPSIKFLGL